jgi:hypothetical protein
MSTELLPNARKLLAHLHHHARTSPARRNGISCAGCVESSWLRGAQGLRCSFRLQQLIRFGMKPRNMTCVQSSRVGRGATIPHAHPSPSPRLQTGETTMKYARFGMMIATSTVVMLGLMYLNTYQLDHVFFSETRA